MTYTDVDDVGTELGRAISDTAERDQIQQWIQRVEGRIARRVPELDLLVGDPAYLGTLQGVVVAVVARKVRNPEGLRSERIDDYYYDRSDRSSPADLWPTAEEWAELLPESAQGAFSTRPSFEPDGWGPWL